MERDQHQEPHPQLPIRKDQRSGIPPQGGADLPDQQGGESQTGGGSGIHLPPDVQALWNKGRESRASTVWGPPLEITKADYDKALAQGRITEEEYDEIMEDRRLSEEEEHR